MEKLLLFGIFAQLLAGCVPVQPTYLTLPADPSLSGKPLGYNSVTGATRQFRPSEPKGWEELNRRVGPKQ